MMTHAIRPMVQRSLLITALMLALGGCAKQGTPAPQAPAATVEPVPASVQEAARGVIEQYRQAYQVRSLDALLPLYARSPDLVMVRQGRPIAGWDQVQDHLTSLITRAEEIQLELEDVRIIALGQGGAAVTARVTRTVHDNATSVREEGLLTLALRQDGERWVIASEHFSHPPKI